MNIVLLHGVLSSTPVVRQLASGGQLLSLEVTTETGTGVCSVPVSWFDPPRVPTWDTGAAVAVVGVVRRRFFRRGGTTHTRTEVVADQVLPARARCSVERAFAAACEWVGAFGGSALRSG